MYTLIDPFVLLGLMLSIVCVLVVLTLMSGY